MVYRTDHQPIGLFTKVGVATLVEIFLKIFIYCLQWSYFYI